MSDITVFVGFVAESMTGKAEQVLLFVFKFESPDGKF